MGGAPLRQGSPAPGGPLHWPTPQTVLACSVVRLCSRCGRDRDDRARCRAGAGSPSAHSRARPPHLRRPVRPDRGRRSRSSHPAAPQPSPYLDQWAIGHQRYRTITGAGCARTTTARRRPPLRCRDRRRPDQKTRIRSPRVGEPDDPPRRTGVTTVRPSRPRRSPVIQARGTAGYRPRPPSTLRNVLAKMRASSVNP
jgi:hypothetical protein